jgi:SPX domain protein involved in polyphosphate accumulation
MSSGEVYRYELKFLISEAERVELLEQVQGNLGIDPHGGEHGCYRVTSQYYDSPALSAYWEKMDGEKVRKKYRLRFYGDRPDHPFFEIKHRYDRTIRKERVALQPEKAEKFLAECQALQFVGELVSCQSQADRSLTERLVAAGVLELLRPVVIITYLRQAFVGRWDPGLRLTFDHHCQALPPGEIAHCGEDRGYPLAPGHPIVMEIKFNQRVPRWLVDCVNRVGLKQIRFSKYAQGVDALQLAKESRLKQTRSV